MAPVRAVLWDADGVLQQGLPAWPGVFADLVGDRVDTFGAAVWGALDDALSGRVDMRAHVDSVVHEMGLDQVHDEILQVWGMIDPLVESRDLVTAVRADGVGCYLATNQDTLRASYMRDLMGYDELLDGSYYSCELRVAKPAPGFFHHIAGDLGLASGELLFVDDQPENVEGARRVGLRAEQWHHSQGITVLRGLLADHGVEV